MSKVYLMKPKDFVDLGIARKNIIVLETPATLINDFIVMATICRFTDVDAIKKTDWFRNAKAGSKLAIMHFWGKEWDDYNGIAQTKDIGKANELWFRLYTITEPEEIRKLEFELRDVKDDLQSTSRALALAKAKKFSIKGTVLNNFVQVWRWHKKITLLGALVIIPAGWATIIVVEIVELLFVFMGGAVGLPIGLLARLFFKFSYKDFFEGWWSLASDLLTQELK